MLISGLIFLLYYAAFAHGVSPFEPPPSSPQNLRTTEYTALEDFYYALGGPQWVYSSPTAGPVWNFTLGANPCLEQWQGLTCQRVPGTNSSTLIAIFLNRFNLVGQVPDSMRNFTSLMLVGLNGNHISGPIPSLLGDLKRLQVIGMSNNDLTGTLPDNLSTLLALRWLDLNQNNLEGSIPASYASLTLMNNFDLYGNQLTGTIPAFLGTFTQLSYLFLGRNFFQGPIPTSVGELSLLEYLALDHNSLTGTVPTTFAQLAKLQYLYLFNNDLRGPIYSIFNASAQVALTVVSMSGNQFTGQLPDDLFLLPNISTLDAGSNCLSGSLPHTICSANRLVSFVFDGANAASSCHAQLLPGLANTYKIQHPFVGGIPHCVYSLPYLHTLQLASNGFTGHLPSKANFSAFFANLSLSYNFLQGTIPRSFQTHPWHVFDISNNKFTGILRSDFAAQNNESELSMRNNRLSGDIPESIIHSTGLVNVLQGNVFTCDVSESDLPEQDENLDTYNCGSNSFNASYYFWVTTSGFLCIVALFLFVIRKKGAARSAETAVPMRQLLSTAITKARAVVDILCIRDADGAPIVAQLRRYNKVCNISKMLLNMSVFVSLLAVVIMLPYYGIISEYYGTHTYQYAYQVSMIYKSGVVPLVLGMFLLLVLLVVIFFKYGMAFRQYQSDTVLFERDIEYRPSDASSRDSYSHEEETITFEKTLTYVLYGIIDVIVVVGANLAFVYVVLYKSHRAVFFAQAALSIFKIAWSNVCSLTTHYLASEMKFESQNIKKGLLTMLFLITLFNNIVVPCLVMMAVSTQCFYNIFVPGENVTYSGYVHCVEYNLDRTCRTRELYTESRSFQAPFVYTYECATSFLTAYAPSFVYLCIIQGLLTPALRYAGQKLFHATAEDSYLHRVLKYCLPAILKPLHDIPKKMWTPRFDARMQIVTLLNYLAVIMTFGMVFPPLAVSMAMTIVSTVFWSRLEVKNYLQEAAARGMPEHINLIDECCAAVGSDTMLLRVVWVLIGLSCWFYTLFLFDTLGDDVGLSKSYWVLIMMPMMPFVLYGLFKLRTGTCFVRRRERVVSSVRVVGKNLEMLKQLHLETMSPMSKTASSRGSMEEESL